mgnify:CR=1 FL=1
MKKESRILVVYKCDKDLYVLVVYRGHIVEDLSFSKKWELIKVLHSMKTFGEIKYMVCSSEDICREIASLGIKTIEPYKSLQILLERRRDLKNLCCIWEKTILKESRNTLVMCK